MHPKPSKRGHPTTVMFAMFAMPSKPMPHLLAHNWAHSRHLTYDPLYGGKRCVTEDNIEFDPILINR